MALKTQGLRFRETMAGYMSPAGSFRAGYRWGKAAGGEVRFTATIAIPDLDTFLQDPEHAAALSARLDYDGLGWDLQVKAGRFHLFCRRNDRTRMLYYLPFTCGGQTYLLFGQKFVGDRAPARLARPHVLHYPASTRMNQAGRSGAAGERHPHYRYPLSCACSPLRTSGAVRPSASFGSRALPERLHARTGRRLRTAVPGRASAFVLASGG
jgi:hypothetical protein